MGLFSSKKQTVTLEPMMPEWQLQTGQNLANWANKYMNNFVPGQAYTGQFTAGMSPFETTGLNMLNRILSNTSGTGDMFNLASSRLQDILSGKLLNPATNPVIQSTKTLSAQNLQDQLDAAHAAQGARGAFFSTPALGEDYKLRLRSANNLDSIIAGVLQNEQDRIGSAIPLGQQFDQYKNITAPLQLINASQTLGALPRTLQQSEFDKLYQDYQRQRSEAALPLQVGQGVFGTNVPYGVKSWEQNQPSTFQSTVLPILQTVLPLVLGAMNPAAGVAAAGIGAGMGSMSSGGSGSGSLQSYFASNPNLLRGNFSLS